MSEVIDNIEKSRFELSENGKIAFADYLVREGILQLPHVEADPALRGTGAAGRLMEGVLAIAQERDLKVKPICSYAVAYLKKHADYAHLLS